MSFIFTKFDIKSSLTKLTSFKYVKSALSFAKSHKTLVKIGSFAIVGLIAIIISVMAIDLQVGFNVSYSGKVIATVSDTSVFDNAKNIAVKNVNGEKADEAIEDPFFIVTLTVADKFSSPDTLADAIIENSDDIVYGTALLVNGETVFCTGDDGLRDLAEARLTEYYVDNATNTASFVDLVEIQKGYYLKKDLKNVFEAESILNELDVKTVSTVLTETTVRHSTKKIKSSNFEKGYYKLSKKGQNGITRTSTVTETINGVQSAAPEVTKTVVSEPVEQIEIHGTGIPKVTASQKAEASSKGFIRPLNPGTYKVTSYYGDGRNHKGIDLAANKGVAIFAVADGVVTYAGYKSDFGYNVIVDHGNGIQTRYAHASALCVSQGTRVSQGEMIAAVGNTGYSLGNHLHFEVIVNGTRVNPAPYIGL